jgi:hypothetical protein
MHRQHRTVVSTFYGNFKWPGGLNICIHMGLPSPFPEYGKKIREIRVQFTLIRSTPILFPLLSYSTQLRFYEYSEYVDTKETWLKILNSFRKNLELTPKSYELIRREFFLCGCGTLPRTLCHSTSLNRFLILQTEFQLTDYYLGLNLLYAHYNIQKNFN